MGIVEQHDNGAVRHIVLSRAEKRNALNEELVEGLHEAFEETAADESVRVVVLRGDGPMFSAGLDLSALKALSTTLTPPLTMLSLPQPPPRSCHPRSTRSAGTSRSKEHR